MQVELATLARGRVSQVIEGPLFVVGGGCSFPSGLLSSAVSAFSTASRVSASPCTTVPIRPGTYRPANPTRLRLPLKGGSRVGLVVGNPTGRLESGSVGLVGFTLVLQKTL
jgi:hypothetical protein